MKTPEPYVKYIKVTIKIPERRHRYHRFIVFNVNSEQISHIVLVFPMLNLNKKMPTGEHVVSHAGP